MSPWKTIWEVGPLRWIAHESGVGRGLVVAIGRLIVKIGTTPKEEG